MNAPSEKIKEAYDRLIAGSTALNNGCRKANCTVVNVPRGGRRTRTATTPARLVWIIERGPLASKYGRIKRSCGTPDCISAEHLYLTDGSTSRKAECVYDGCTSKRETGDLCALHWLSLKLTRRAQNDRLKPECTQEDCHSHWVAKGLCARHYAQYRRGTLNYPRPSTCIVEGCFVKPRAKGLCGPHYSRSLTGEDPADMLPGPRRCGTPSCDSRAWRDGLCGEHWTEESEVTDGRQRDVRPYSKLR